MSNKKHKVALPSSQKKLIYDVVLTTGKSERALIRSKEKKYDKMKKGENTSMLGKMRSRQERKAMAKSLKVAFNPRYNGVVTKKAYKLVETLKDGKPTGYTHLVLEAI